MSVAARARPVTAARGSGLVTTNARRTSCVLLLAVLLLVVAVCSLMVGTRVIPPREVLAALFSPDSSQAALVVTDQRVPRTVLGVAVGAALAVAGALIMALTRNPLADPGLLGVNAGASYIRPIAGAALAMADVELTGQHYASRVTGRVAVTAETEPVTGQFDDRVLDAIAEVAVLVPRR
ncbi:iron chelate uptake ABC transporter family permease subunit [Actinophytocola oryzae]|uniref:FecCD transport family protein n=1 Tax=Actinophytocola oryzae TaxID=502181 RepID=A0A4R7VL77_9PSEU|nr:iron chelate uptake ABC transporter family permease subunit [Actinophytocola oryzae]TDV49959.1 FecCD transport family protein [Actinophytocola oryzae]